MAIFNFGMIGGGGGGIKNGIYHDFEWTRYQKKSTAKRRCLISSLTPPTVDLPIVDAKHNYIDFLRATEHELVQYEGDIFIVDSNGNYVKVGEVGIIGGHRKFVGTTITSVYWTDRVNNSKCPICGQYEGEYIPIFWLLRAAGSFSETNIATSTGNNWGASSSTTTSYYALMYDGTQRAQTGYVLQPGTYTTAEVVHAGIPSTGYCTGTFCLYRVNDTSCALRIYTTDAHSGVLIVVGGDNPFNPE